MLISELGIPDDQLESIKDPDAYHVLAYNGKSEPIGTGCINTDGQLGFVLVLNEWRGRTVGLAILKYLLLIARRLDLPSVTVECPENVVNFYMTEDFEKTDHSFERDGVQYWKLVKVLDKSKPLVH